MRFRTEILGTGKTAAGIVVPADVLEGLAAGKKPAVRVSINGYAYRSSIATVDGRPMIGVSNDVRSAAGVAAGEVVDVEVELDTEKRTVALPAELEALLAADPVARAAYDKLSYSNQRRIVEPIDQTKNPDTRQRRIDKAIETLRAG
jgi:Bacteriocin-protection, YdeI or OmpD-Associated/Domain of unknown function (DUF1905)